ncbi:hypothetical protein Desor_3825 [Desulfosporosinus orientis DSM 765]|uniref:Deacetylase PdaC domain-containing protein n=1 Tax=Desulfosporosinus orientis (strain ATCC 19365 / DSM 765 / NCIMB 8382 / VKM B-1628 / Singapore I) TaxID=768706 RepID=G7W9E7_DESOD|nr:hypothetical protein [Desulfosporosinus orientis]AET69284.1 hypothetical protein Desor_3825 [Desulfosporosinus orientis DSM 765]
MNLPKKLMIFMGIFIMCLELTGCSVKNVAEKQQSQNLETQTSKPLESQTPEPQAPTDKATMNPDGPTRLLPPYSYETESRNWNVKGITVKYPMFVNTSTLEPSLEEKADQANDLIMNDMENLIETIQSNVDDETLTIDGIYEYSQISPIVLSIRYEIDYYAESLAHPVSLYHTLTISLDKDSVIPLSDLFVIDKTFVEDYKSNWMYAPSRDLDLEAAGVNIKEEIANQYSNEDLIRLFSQADAQYYLTDQGLILSIEVPHALGDHLEKAMKYEFLEENMKRDHPLWANYMFLKGDTLEGTLDNNE